MQGLPHHYHVTASGEAEGNITLAADELPSLTTAPPAEFGGPGDQWSPETLLVGAVADCFILTFRAIARASGFDWHHLDCAAEGTLAQVERITRFTHITVNATLTVPAGTDTAKAQRLLEKAESACLVTNSLQADTHLQSSILFKE